MRRSTESPSWRSIRRARQGNRFHKNPAAGCGSREVVQKGFTTPPQAGPDVESYKQKVMTNLAYSFLSAGIGAGLCVLGVGIGIGRLAASALDATGRQPAATGDIRTTMLIAAALIEGVGLFGLVVSILLATKAG